MSTSKRRPTPEGPRIRWAAPPDLAGVGQVTLIDSGFEGQQLGLTPGHQLFGPGQVTTPAGPGEDHDGPGTIGRWWCRTPTVASRRSTTQHRAGERPPAQRSKFCRGVIGVAMMWANPASVTASRFTLEIRPRSATRQIRPIANRSRRSSSTVGRVARSLVLPGHTR